MELYSVEMALAIAVGFATMTHWLASMVENREPVSNGNRELADVDSPASLLSSAESSSASMVENPEPVPEENQELVPSTSLVSSAAPWQKYDVFLSFRGADTRKGFVSHLHHELQTVRGIQTFKDDKDLETGAPISSSLLKAIEESNFAIVVLSENYAQSAWCLEELTKICQCMKDKNRILPLFYYVQPSDVRHQNGTFGDALTKHGNSGRHNSEKVQRWRDALHRVAGFSGRNAQDFQTERDLVEAIVDAVGSKVRPIETEFIISSIHFEPFEATREAMDKVMEALKDENITIIGVYGIGGVGKSTMVEHVGLEAQKKRLFPQVILARISPEPNVWNIQGTLADMLGLKLVDETVIGRARTLRKKITSGDRILIILDNIWEGIELTSIGIPRFNELKRCNSKVLLTTRKRDVCYRMQCQASIRLNTLTEQDSWKLFAKEARNSFKTSTFYNKARQVSGECGGLPVALKAVAKALGDKELDEWNKAAERLKVSQPPHPEDEKVVFECIKLSYDYLKSDVSKSCFLLCCLFPEDYDIKIEDLLKYGIGKGLFEESNMQNARDTIHTIIESLKDSSLLLDAKGIKGCVRMHDVIRDVAIQISLQFFVRAGCELQYWPRIDAGKGYIAISLMKNKICTLPAEHLVFPKLHILLLQSNIMNNIPVSSFQRLKALRVLDLSYTAISLLPTSFNLLTSLHTLYLDGCLSRISNISLLGRLKKLEILSMRELPLLKLPKEIGQLTTLRMLDFTSVCVDIVPSKVISNLNKLEELYIQCDFADWGSKAEGSEVKGNTVEESEAEGAREETNASFDEFTSLLHLQILKVFISDPKCLPTDVEVKSNWKSFDICICRDPSIRESLLDPSSPLDSKADSKALTLDTTMDTLPKWFTDVVTKKTEKLQYRNCRGLVNVLKEYYQGTLHSLKYLHVIGPSDKLEQLMTTITPIPNEPVFENLEELHLDGVNCLKELCVGELPNQSLCKLRLLEVRGCPELMNALLQSNLLKRLPNLEKLSCEEMDKLEYVFSYEGSEVEQSTLTELIEMRLENLGNLIKIWNGPAPCEIFCHVKTLVVFECNKLKNLFTSDIAHHLHDLEDLSVEACLGLERVIEASEETVNDKIVLPKLKKLALKKLLKLTRFYGSTGSATNDEECIEFPLLEHSHVERCHIFNSPAKDMLVSMMNKQPVLIPMQVQREVRETHQL
ncbi:putative toll-like receptor, P-loop containing nucleoside triphosphate hydrolase [Rosa chinensis]|uniref:Putative toll-like receptor, P-loop containing nucleoside triphosphate hydrolase n=1 Tax=Rosa chinensis TaxID=74649 RepID=A0A2P6QMR2_ROSCH|nr:disease resistance protein RUN1 isoform X2 [Rosa chinensis]PRQ35459.1 putative toll-like receptor, P-loop containing nucleoside triphosphate hydrolase [Rosa chinensis]